MASNSTHSSFPSFDLGIGGRTFVRVSGKRPAWSGPLTVMHSAPDGGPVLKEKARPWTWGWVSTVSGVLVCTRRGSVLVQFRRWGA